MSLAERLAVTFEVKAICSAHQHLLVNAPPAYSRAGLLRHLAVGNGGYGRLGHVKQEDQFKPKLIETFNQRVPVAPNVVFVFLHTACCPLLAAFHLLQ